MALLVTRHARADRGVPLDRGRRENRDRDKKAREKEELVIHNEVTLLVTSNYYTHGHELRYGLQQNCKFLFGQLRYIYISNAS